MSEQRKKLKTWQGWAIFGGAMVFVFCLGLLPRSSGGIYNKPQGRDNNHLRQQKR